MSRISVPNEELHALMEDIRLMRRDGLSSEKIAEQLSLELTVLTDLERRYRGMNDDQIQHLLFVERDNERLVEDNRRLREQLADLEGSTRGRFD